VRSKLQSEQLFMVCWTFHEWGGKMEVGLARKKAPPDMKLLSRKIEVADGSQLFRLQAKPTNKPVKSF
jgi:hypothetical protein